MAIWAFLETGSEVGGLPASTDECFDLTLEFPSSSVFWAKQSHPGCGFVRNLPTTRHQQNNLVAVFAPASEPLLLLVET